MSFSLFQANLPFRTVIQYLRYLPPDGSVSADEWSSKEVESLGIGDILFFLDVTRSQFGDPTKGIGVSEGDSFRATSLINVFRLDGDWPMGFAMSGDKFEMGFVGDMLTAKAEEALENKTGLYYLLARLNEPLKQGQHLTDLSEMHKWGNGQRSAAPRGLPDPLHVFLDHIGVAVEPSGEKQPVEIESLAYYLFKDEDSEPSPDRVPNLRTKMSGVRKESPTADSTAGAPAPAGEALPLSALFDEVPKAPGSPGGAAPVAKKPGGLGISSLFSDWEEPEAADKPEPTKADKPASKTGESAKPSLAALFSDPADPVPTEKSALTPIKPVTAESAKPATGLSALFPDWEDAAPTPAPPPIAKPANTGGLGALFADWQEPVAESTPEIEPVSAAAAPIAPQQTTEVRSASPTEGGQHAAEVEMSAAAEGATHDTQVEAAATADVAPRTAAMEAAPGTAVAPQDEQSAAAEDTTSPPSQPEATGETKPGTASGLSSLFSDWEDVGSTSADAEATTSDTIGEWQEPPLTASLDEDKPGVSLTTESVPSSAEEPVTTDQTEDLSQMAAALEEVAAGLDASAESVEAPAEKADAAPESSPQTEEAPATSNDQPVESSQTESPSLSSLFSDMLPDAFPDHEAESESPQLSSVLSDLAASTDSTTSSLAPADSENAASLSALFSDFQSDELPAEEQPGEVVSDAATTLELAAADAQTETSQELFLDDTPGDLAPVAEVTEATSSEQESSSVPPPPVGATGALPPLLELPPIPVRSPAQPVPSPSIPGVLTAGLLDLKLGSGLLPGGSSGLIAKLEQQAQRAGVRIEEKLIEIQERLVKDRIFNLRKVQIKEEASERNITNLKTVLFRKVTAAGDEVKSELRTSAEEGRGLLAGFADTASQGILQERESLLQELAASPEEITPLSIQGESLLIHMDRARERGAEALNLELKVHTEKLDQVEAEIMDELQARLTKLRGRVAITESAVLTEEKEAIARFADELQEIRNFVIARLNTVVEQLCASLSRSANLAGLNLSMEADRLCREILLERIASAKQSLPGLTLTLREQLRLELDSDAEVRLAEITPLLNSSKDTIDAMAKEAVEITVFTGDKEKADLDQTLETLSRFFEEKQKK